MNKKQVQIIIAISSTILFSFGLCFFIFYGSNDLFKFPFIADVWGTVVDWILAAVTIGTLILLWKTLRSQMKVQEYQAEITRIELHKHTLSIRPEFSLDVQILATIDEGGDLFSTVFHMTFSVLNAGARNATFYFSPNVVKHQIGYIHDRMHIGRVDINRPFIMHFVNLRCKLDATYEDLEGNKIKDTYAAVMTTTIIYQDIDGNWFKQIVACVIRKDGKSEMVSNPLEQFPSEPDLPTTHKKQ